MHAQQTAHESRWQQTLINRCYYPQALFTHPSLDTRSRRRACACRYEGVYWSATTAAQTFGVKMSVSNQGTLPGKIGAIKFWSVPFGSPFVPSCNATADFSTALKSDTIAPLGKSKTFTVKGIPAPATPGKKTLVGFVDGGGLVDAEACGKRAGALRCCARG
jgi:hypothetical protein